MSTFSIGEAVSILPTIAEEKYPTLYGLLGVVEKLVTETSYVVIFKIDEDVRGWAPVLTDDELIGFYSPDPEDYPTWHQPAWTDVPE